MVDMTWHMEPRPDDTVTITTRATTGTGDRVDAWLALHAYAIDLTLVGGVESRPDTWPLAHDIVAVATLDQLPDLIRAVLDLTPEPITITRGEPGDQPTPALWAMERPY